MQAATSPDRARSSSKTWTGRSPRRRSARARAQRRRLRQRSALLSRRVPGAAGLRAGARVRGRGRGAGRGRHGLRSGRPRGARAVHCLPEVRRSAAPGTTTSARQRKASGLNAPGGLREYMTLPAYAMYPAAARSRLRARRAVRTAGCRRTRPAARRPAVRRPRRCAGRRHDRPDGIAAARAMGATYVAATARHPHQAADGAGARRGRGVRRRALEGIGEITQPRRAARDVVVETVGGHANTLAGVADVVGVGGRDQRARRVHAAGAAATRSCSS